MALLFSAGTFLFVASHLVTDMNEAATNTSDAGSTAVLDGDENGYDFLESQRKLLRRQRTLSFVAGMATPLVLNTLFGGHHHH